MRRTIWPFEDPLLRRPAQVPVGDHPLELHGVVALKNGQVVRVSIGNGEGDPLFTIDDLLPHLGVEQSRKPWGRPSPPRA